jgi:hypothetical protein
VALATAPKANLNGVYRKNPVSSAEMKMQHLSRRRSVNGKKAMKGIVFSLVLGLGGGIFHAAAQGADAEVAYVESVRGRVVASDREAAPMPLDMLDIIGDRTRLDLPAKSELRICHHRMGKILKLQGPLRASVSASGVTTENGKTIDATSETCAAPVISTFQGGFVTRSAGLTTAKVSLRPSIKVVDRGASPIRKITLWDDMHRPLAASFARNMGRPVLEQDKSYLLVVERHDGDELKMILQASGANQAGPLIVVVR